MGNKPSMSEGEDEDERPPLSLKGAKSLGTDLTNGGGDDADEELELPPPMKPIQEPILVTSPPPGVPDIEENPCKREQHSENQERNSLVRETRSSDAISEYSGDIDAHRDLTAQSSNEASGLAFSGDESDNKTSEENAVDNARKIESFLEKRKFVLKELADTEEAYVRDLALIVDGYITTMKDSTCDIPMPEDLANGKDKMVFGNIEAIYDWHKDIFLPTLKKIIENPVGLAELFKKYERKLYMYVVYCKNKPVSEYIVSEHLDTYFEELRNKLGHKLQLCDLLIKPVQRIMKYQLMLKDILKYTEKAGLSAEADQIRAAYDIMVVVPKAANDMMDVGRLQGFDGKITAQGKLLMHGVVTCSDLPGLNAIGKNKELQVFLFEQSIIFSEIVGKKTQFTSPQYIYKLHIQVNKMDLKIQDDCFTLKSTDPNRSEAGVICQVPPEVHDQWACTLRNIVQTQKDFLKAIQSPIAYQKELTKESPFDQASPWDPTTYRNTISIPATSDTNSVAADVKVKRKTVHYTHKANTIGIPTESDFNGSHDAKNAHRPRLNIFGGFRNTLRSKHKSDSVALDSPKEGEKGDSPRRWSEASTHTSCEHIIMAPGTQARLVCEWPDMALGDVVTIIRYDATQGYLVKTNNRLEEIWIPAHVLSNYNRKAWSFKFRKPSRREGPIAESPTEPYAPEISEKMTDLTAQYGAKVTFKCKIKNCSQSTKLSWKKLEPDVCILRSGRLVLGQNDEGTAVLTLENVKDSDSGKYSVTAFNEYGSCHCAANLLVTDTFHPLQEPKVQIVSSASVLLTWENHAHSSTEYFVEYCKLGTGEWLSPNRTHPVTSQSYVIEHLTPGDTYSFRVRTAQSHLVSLPTSAVTLPVADSLKWQQEQFKRRYLELEEIDRGRFSIVKRAKDRGTQEEVALKEVTRRKQALATTQAEYSLLAGIQHANIIRSMALFENAPYPGIDTIVLELIKGPYLFTYLTENENYLETDAKNYCLQLMSALTWLHEKDIAHLDVKPENIMVDVSTPNYILKLIDFGDSVNTQKNVILPPACLEFASPELVLGQPVGKHTDCWAVGVFLYVLLSGVSPFLDDSMEETTANILKCDYCFPDEYFADISNEAKELINRLLVLIPAQRIPMESCLNSEWLQNKSSLVVIPSSRLKTFMQRRHPTNVATTPTSPNYLKNI